MRSRNIVLAPVCFLVLVGVAASQIHNKHKSASQFLGSAEVNSAQMIKQGRQIFRFDTFGDEAFWGGQLQLHQAINNLTPKNALELGLKVDAQALSPSVVEAIKHKKVNLDDPAVTRMLIEQQAVLGVVGFFDGNHTLTSVGLTCAVCHSTVDNSVAPGIGARIDGLANRDLNVGAIIAAAPNLQPVLDLLKLADPAITLSNVKSVLNSWGSGKFDAELVLDGKAFHNLHTWTGGWGTVTYWNAFVAVNELHIFRRTF